MSKKIPHKKVVVVLPAYNAEKTLKKTVADIPKEWVDEIILVDDGSKDNTVGVAQELGLITFTHIKNLGYGGNQKTCYREALRINADIVVMVHPDFQYDPSFIPEMITPIAEGKYDAMFGSRMVHKRNALNGGMPYWKFVANIGLTMIGNAVLGLSLSEYHSGFRAYGKKVLQLPLDLNSNDFVFDTEIIVQMKVAGMSMGEVPITTRYFPEASMISFRRSVTYGFGILDTLKKYCLFKMRLKHYPQLDIRKR